jgi:GntR family transcriptional repressor for pyruvate dehydrogenase complex
MKSLESLRIVQIRPRVGATVLKPSPADLLHAEHFSIALQKQQTNMLLQFRMIMEVGLASLAAENRTQEDLDAMSAVLEKYRRELDAHQADCLTDMSFHSVLAAASKNPIAVMVWQMLSSRLGEILTKTVVLPNVPENSYRDHLKIFRAIKEGNPRKARQAMRAHLEDADRIWRMALQPSGEREQDQSNSSNGNAQVSSRSHSLPEQAYSNRNHEQQAAACGDRKDHIAWQPTRKGAGHGKLPA